MKPNLQLKNVNAKGNVTQVFIETLGADTIINTEEAKSSALLPLKHAIEPLYPTYKIQQVRSSGDNKLKAKVSISVGLQNDSETCWRLAMCALQNTNRRIAVAPCHFLYPVVTAVPDIGRKQWFEDIGPSDADGQFDPLRIIIDPIEREFGGSLSIGGLAGETDAYCRIPQGVRSSLITVYSSLYTYLIGMKHRLQIDIPMEETKQAVRVILHVSKNRDTQINMLMFQRILEAYEPQPINSWHFNLTADGDKLEAFRQLIEDRQLQALNDPVYSDITAAKYLLGVPGEIQRGLAEMQQHTGAMLRHRLFGRVYKPFQNLAHLLMKGWSSVDVLPPCGKALKEIISLGEGFAPPIVPFTGLPTPDEWLNIQTHLEARRLALPPEVARQLLLTGNT